MNRRSFLKASAAAIAGVVAGIRPKLASDAPVGDLATPAGDSVVYMNQTTANLLANNPRFHGQGLPKIVVYDSHYMCGDPLNPTVKPFIPDRRVVTISGGQVTTIDV